MEPLTEPTADIAGDITRGAPSVGRRWGGQGPPGQHGPCRLGLGTAVRGPVGVTDRLGTAGDGGRCGPGPQREGGGLLAVDHEAGRGGVRAEVGQVVLGELGGDMAGGRGRPRGSCENHTLVRALDETASRSSLGSWPRC